MTNNCQQLKIEYEQLKKLKRNFVAAYEKVSLTGNLAKVKEVKRKLEEARNALAEKLFVTIEKAREILGQENVLGPEEVAKVWGVHLNNIPGIPFPIEQIKNAAKMNMMLVLRVDKLDDGSVLSIKAMNDIWNKEIKKGSLLVEIGNSKAYHFSTDSLNKFCLHEPFCREVSPRPGWALVSKDVLPESLDNSYIDQTEIIATVLQGQVFKDRKMPVAYEEAITEFEARKEEIKSLDWDEAAKALSELKINQLARQSMQETFYDFATHFAISNTIKHLLSDHCTFSNSRSPQGNIMVVGGFALDGMGGWGCGPGFSHSLIGVCLSLRS